ncbi:MAG: 3-ketoacyl-ACP reductase [Chryseolinea sp.]
MMRTALVTGGSRGIGFGIATALANAGFQLSINGLREEQEASEALEKLRSNGTEVFYCRGNIGIAAERKSIVETTIKKFGKIDVLVNNAGVAPLVRQDVLELDEENYDRLLDINLKGTYFLTQDVAKRMIKETASDYNPCIITITSVSATIASINRGEYCISKAGLAMMTKLFATRLAEHNIQVYEVRPGIISTDMTAGVKEKYDSLINNGLTLEKRWGTAEDVGKAVTVLATGLISYATGQVIEVAGGMTIGRL